MMTVTLTHVDTGEQLVQYSSYFEPSHWTQVLMAGVGIAMTIVTEG